jgi:hypothetical protein
MTGVAFALVLASAFSHASWNFLLKRSERVAFTLVAGARLVRRLFLPWRLRHRQRRLARRRLRLGSAVLRSLRFGARARWIGDFHRLSDCVRQGALIDRCSAAQQSISPWGAGIGLVVLGVC